MAVMKVAFRFVQRSVRDLEEASKVPRTKSTETFSSISCRRSTRIAYLFTIFQITPSRTSGSKRKHVALQFKSKLPRDEIFEAPDAHARDRAQLAPESSPPQTPNPREPLEPLEP